MEIRRKVKNVVYKYSEPEILVRKATSNDPWGPTSTIMSEIADLTYNYVAFEEIMPIIWKRLNDKGKNWRHVFKCLVLLDYLIKSGDERIIDICIENIHTIETLKDFQYFEDYKDLGLSVREKSKAIVLLLKNDEELIIERVKGHLVKEKFQGSNSAIGSNSQRRPGDLGKEIRKQYDKESRYSKSVMQLNFGESKQYEEDEDLRKAIELSKEEHENAMFKKRETERLENVKLKLAFDKSREEEEALSVLRPPPKSNDITLNLDLLHITTELDPPQNQDLKARKELNEFADLTHCDPWATSATNGTNVSLDFDPWKTNDNFAVSTVSQNNIDFPAWPTKEIIPNKSIIDDIFGDDKPVIPSWTADSSIIVENSEQGIDQWTEPSEGDCLNNVTGSLAASLTNIGVDHHDLGPCDVVIQHSCSATNLSTAGTRKTAQDFLGDSAKLVNLDNLVPRPTAGVYWDSTSVLAQKNPFGPSSVASSNPFLNNIQNKKPMNAMNRENLPNQLFTSSGNQNSQNINNNYNLFNQMPQTLTTNAHSQHHGFPVTGNMQHNNDITSTTSHQHNGNVAWPIQPQHTANTQSSNQWFIAHPSQTTLNPFT